MDVLPPMQLDDSVATAMVNWDPRYEPHLFWRKIKKVTLSLTGSSTEVTAHNSVVSSTEVRTIAGSATADNGGAHIGYSTGTFSIVGYPLDGPYWDAQGYYRPPSFSVQAVGNGTVTRVVSFSGPSAPDGYTTTDDLTSLTFGLVRKPSGLWEASGLFGDSAPLEWGDWDQGGQFSFPLSYASERVKVGSTLTYAESSGTINVTLHL